MCVYAAGVRNEFVCAHGVMLCYASPLPSVRVNEV
jgi:hypothetical protein